MEPVQKRPRNRPWLRAWSSRARWWARHELALNQFRGMLLWAGLIGFCGALVTIGFREAIELIEFVLTGETGSLVQVATDLPLWRRLLTPALGGCLAGLILHYGMSLAKGKRRTTDYMEALTVGDGFISIRASLVKSTSSLFSIGSGGSIGREGAMVQLAAMFGSTLCRVLKFPTPQRRTMVACGAAAGIASAYILGVSRAVGETMILAVAAGMQPNLGFNPLEPAATITSYIVQVALGDLPHGSVGYQTIFAAGLVLMLLTLFFNMLGYWIRRKYREAY